MTVNWIVFLFDTDSLREIDSSSVYVNRFWYSHYSSEQNFFVPNSVNGTLYS